MIDNPFYSPEFHGDYELVSIGRLDLEEGGTVWRRLAADAHRGVPDEAWRAVRDAC